MVDFSKPNPDLIRKMRESSDDELFRYLENAKGKLPDAQWFVDAIVNEQVERGGLRNLNANSIREVILKFARQGKTCSYKMIADELGVSWEQAHWRLPGILGEVSEMEHAQGRPLLTAIVVSQEGKCGSGFFEMARRNGAVITGEARFQDEGQQRVFAYWQER